MMKTQVLSAGARASPEELAPHAVIARFKQAIQ
jgi:hypothetical protein